MQVRQQSSQLREPEKSDLFSVFQKHLLVLRAAVDINWRCLLRELDLLVLQEQRHQRRMEPGNIHVHSA